MKITNHRYDFMNGKKIVIGIIIFLAISFGIVFLPMHFGTRGLSDQEKEILEPLYSNGVDLDAIRIKFGGPATLVYPGITIGNTISFPKNKYDFAQEKYQALLVHEVCHVWQYQNFGLGYIPRSLWETFTQHDTYVVHYDKDKMLREYDVEEQCEIFAEYFLSEDEKYLQYIQELKSR